MVGDIVNDDERAKWLSDRKRNQEFEKWRRRAQDAMPGLAARVFDLRRKSYMGSGFHYGMERELGYCLSRLNDVENVAELHLGFGDDNSAIAKQIVLQVRVRMLFEDVVKAERSLVKGD